ncbi:MAG: transporter ATP-binding protein [Polyangiaceae bacterium]|jgi:phospholipid/cholesterol/gamma-HCH transport system ATP-binding protein|nr:transporter ATP-binding protein [Polyangiaceae bacterium]
MKRALISVEGLRMGHGETVLLEDASFEVARGDVFIILGGSGCGKSTLLRHLIGLDTAMAGRIVVAGRTPRLEGNAPRYGVMFQSGALFGSMTVGENVAFALQEWTHLPVEAVQAIVRAKLALVGLEGAEDKLPAELSGGMRKRAAIARAMAFEPSLIFLDEPSAGLDPVSAVELDELILALNRNLGLTVVMVTHELESIFKVGKTCIMLDRESRSIIARGEPERLRRESDDPRVRRFFNRETSITQWQ